MDTLLILGGFLGFIGCIVWLIVMAVKRQPKKKAFMGIGLSIVMFLTGGFMAPAPEPETVKEPEKTEATRQVEAETATTVDTKTETSAEETIAEVAPAVFYKVLRVVDGDTIEVSMNGKTEKVRLIGIDTPESVHPDASRNNEDGKTASEYTKSQLEGQQVQLEFDVQERDKYGRLLAYVWFNDAMFNKTLLSEGYAQVSTYPPNVKYVDDFTALEKQSRELGKGLWATSAPAQSTSPSSTQSAQASDPVTATYVASKNSDKFHYSSCKSAKKIKSSNLITFSSRDAAVNSGRTPCSNCTP